MKLYTVEAEFPNKPENERYYKESFGTDEEGAFDAYDECIEDNDCEYVSLECHLVYGGMEHDCKTIKKFEREKN